MRNAKAAQLLEAALERPSATAVAIAQSKQLESIAELARVVPLVIRAGDCAVCGAKTLSIWALELDVQPRPAPERDVAMCPTCQTRTVMLGVPHAGR